MSEQIIIIGAGMAGLLAGNMLRRHKVQIVEQQSSLPNNHHAVLRFRTNRVSEQTHIPFQNVKVFKACDEDDPIRAAMLYSRKVSGHYEVRSLINLETCERFIAPPDFINQMSNGLNIAYGVDGRAYLIPDRREEIGAVISTLPMPFLMDALEYDGPRPDFRHTSGFTVTIDLVDCNIYATRYFVKPSTTLYRASITGNKFAAEFVGHLPSGEETEMVKSAALEALVSFGYDVNLLIGQNMDCHQSRFAKLATLSADDRRLANQFMYWASTQMNVYSLGRFATWRSGLLLDGVVDDIIKIERWIVGGNYDLKKGM